VASVLELFEATHIYTKLLVLCVCVCVCVCVCRGGGRERGGSPSIFKTVKSRLLWWAVDIAEMGGSRNTVTWKTKKEMVK